MRESVYKIFPVENYTDLTIMQFGYKECAPLRSFGPCVSNHYILHYVISGRGNLRTTSDNGEFKDYIIEGGQGFLIWPGQKNENIADDKNPWTYAWIELDGIKAQEFVIKSGLTIENPVYTLQDLEKLDKVKKELLHIAAHPNDPTMELMGHFYLLLSALIMASAAHRETEHNSTRNFYVHEAIDFIEQNYQKEITVEDIANFCSLDRSYLAKIFKTELKVSPHDFLIHYRMNMAQELMKITERNIGEISEMVGYSNLFNFSRAFKKVTGQSPSEWRAENKVHENK